MKCVSCGAPLSPGVDECSHCLTLNDTDFRKLGKARVQEAAVQDDAAECPRCRKPMLSLKISIGESYPVHRCKGCLGTFFAGQHLEHLVRSVIRGTNIEQARIAQLCRETPREVWPITYIPCPLCAEMMRRKNFGQNSGVMVDSCLQHGIWLDGGELGRILTWARAESARF